MKVTWINHAGFAIESGKVNLVCDPWIEGTAFDNGWQLLAPTLFKYEDFKNVTHIWFSHEHPDHFSPPNLKKIDPEIRNQITILYQKTSDKKVIRFCEKLGFKAIIELPPSTWYSINSNFKIINQNDTNGDSWLGIKAENFTLLNLNDVVTYSTEKELLKLKQILGKVDVLYTQFSYASWGGNKENKAYRERAAKEKLDGILLQSKILVPTYIVPFASFVWFCHHENFYTNDSVNKIRDVFELIENKTKAKAIVMYPNNVWEVGQQHNSLNAVEQYELDEKNINTNTKLIIADQVAMPELIEQGNKYVQEIIKNNSFFVKIKLKKSANIFVTDYEKSFSLSLKGFKQNNIAYNECDIALSSSALMYCFKHQWGGSSLSVNGRFQVPNKGSYKIIDNYFYMANINNQGKSYGLPHLFEILKGRVKRKIG